MYYSRPTFSPMKSQAARMAKKDTIPMVIYSNITSEGTSLITYTPDRLGEDKLLTNKNIAE